MKVELERDDFEEPYYCSVVNMNVTIRGKAFFHHRDGSDGICAPFHFASSPNPNMTCDRFPACIAHKVTVVGEKPCQFVYDSLFERFRRDGILP